MKRGLVVTGRDRQLFQLLFEHRVLGVPQIKEALFSNVSLQFMNRRLNHLADAHYLRKYSFMRELKSVYVYSVNEKGIRAFAKGYAHNITTPTAKSDSISHDIDLFYIRKAFGRLKLLDAYYTENMLQTCEDLKLVSVLRHFSEMNSDVAIGINSPAGKFVGAVEYEAAAKSDQRYRTKLTGYYLRSEIRFVLYVCKNERTLEQICNVDRELGNQFKTKTYFGLEKNILEHNGEMAFSNHLEKRFVLK